MAHACMSEEEILERQKLNKIFIKLTSNPLKGMETLCPTNELNEIRERISLLKSLLLDNKNNRTNLHPNRGINNKLVNRGKKAMKILINRFMELDKMLSTPVSSSKTAKNRRKKQRQKKRKEALKYLNSVVLSRTPSPSDECPELVTLNPPNPTFEKEWERLYRQMSRQGGKKRKTKKRKTKKRKTKKRKTKKTRKSTRKR